MNTENIKIVISDVDGVLTDGKLLYIKGELHRFFSVKDGPGFELLKLAGIKTAVISGKGSEDSKKRLQALGTDYYFDNINNKMDIVEKYIISKNIQWNEICYIGDDFYDIPLMKKVGLPMSPSDAVSEVKDIALYVCRNCGGAGVFREAVELILKGKGIWEEVFRKYLCSLC